MMEADRIVAILRERITALRERSKARMTSIHPVIAGKETDEQRKVVNSAQADYEAADILSTLLEEIER